MEGDIFAYNSFKAELLEGIHNLESGGNTFKITLHNGYTPDIDSDAVWADVSATEYGTGGGYTADGKTLVGQDVAQDNSNDRAVLDAVDVTWTALTLSPATPSHAIVRNATVSGEPLCFYIELGSTESNGTDYTIRFNEVGVLALR